jgi:hypothetical protein
MGSYEKAAGSGPAAADNASPIRCRPDTFQLIHDALYSGS